MRARGLKHAIVQYRHPALTVAPHAGAWIETLMDCDVQVLFTVAPHAGAWIETTSVQAGNANYNCRAPCGRVD